jgi:hypothetical protein
LKNGLIGKVLFLVIVLATGMAFGAKPDGDTPDGSRSNFVHMIPLLAEPLPGKEPDQIHPDADPVLPFSTKATCGACHNYDKISAGWHFNAIDPNVNPGRKGQPWIFADPTSATQIPLSYRKWPGAFRPEQIGLTPMAFLQSFGRQMPGGAIGEMVDKSENPEEALKSDITGKLEINCLACHNGSPGEDMGGASGYSIQVIRGNYRWAATASCEFAYITGSIKDLKDYDFRAPFVSSDSKLKPPVVAYRKEAFGYNDKVSFDIRLEPTKERCYFCHSNADVQDGNTEKWFRDEDVHIAAGLVCADCHRNGVDHNIIRGYASEPCNSTNQLAANASCEGCHFGTKGKKPDAGRFAAPTPKHAGIPPSHFDKLSCTACHSGPWPANETIRTKTARAHALGIAGAKKYGDILPHLQYPVFAKGQDGKIGVFKLLWPAYWATMSDGNVIMPLAMETVKSATSRVITKTAFSETRSWPDLKDEDIVKILTVLGEKVNAGAKPVYVTGGKLYSLDAGGKLVSADNKMAEPYMWPIAHDIRPAAQALGVRNCQDCHTTNSPFLFGLVSVDSPLKNLTAKEMVAFENLPRCYTKAFAFSFVFRPWLKVVAILSLLVILGVLVLYALKALGFVAKVVVGDEK